jgi:hypothetical protein
MIPRKTNRDRNFEIAPLPLACLRVRASLATKRGPLDLGLAQQSGVDHI